MAKTFFHNNIEVLLFILVLFGLVLALSINSASSTSVSKLHEHPITPTFEQTTETLNTRIQQCLFPCWGGWQIGLTSGTIVENDPIWQQGNQPITDYPTRSEDAQEIFASFITGNMALEVEQEFAETHLHVLISGNPQAVLVALSIGIDTPAFDYIDWTSYFPPAILRTYGPPDEVTLAYHDDHDIYLRLHYKLPRLVIGYSIINWKGNLIDTMGNVTLCNDPSLIFHIDLWVEAGMFNSEDFWKEYSPNYIWATVRQQNQLDRDIQEIMDLPLDEFAQQFQIEGNCIQSQSHPYAN